MSTIIAQTEHYVIEDFGADSAGKFLKRFGLSRKPEFENIFVLKKSACADTAEALTGAMADAEAFHLDQLRYMPEQATADDDVFGLMARVNLEMADSRNRSEEFDEVLPEAAEQPKERKHDKSNGRSPERCKPPTLPQRSGGGSHRGTQHNPAGA